MTRADNQANYRTRKKNQGLVRVEMWVPKEYVDNIRANAEGYESLAELKIRQQPKQKKPSTTGDKDPET